MLAHASFEPVADLSLLHHLRMEYLDSIELAQEPSLEVLVPDSAYASIVIEGERCGYTIIHGDGTLLELYLTRPYWVFAQGVCEQLVAEGRVKKALIKTFDHLLFSSCVAMLKSIRLTGLLARDLVDRGPAERLESAQSALQCRTRQATLDDLPAILAVDQKVFRHPERLRMVIEAGQLHLFENDAAVVGFGIARPIIAGRPDVELGIAIDKPYRSQGQSTVLFRSLIDACVQRGLRPVAGLAPDNIASRSMGERAGLVGRHRLLELTF